MLLIVGLIQQKVIPVHWEEEMESIYFTGHMCRVQDQEMMLGGIMNTILVFIGILPVGKIWNG